MVETRPRGGRGEGVAAAINTSVSPKKRIPVPPPPRTLFAPPRTTDRRSALSRGRRLSFLINGREGDPPPTHAYVPPLMGGEGMARPSLQGTLLA